MLGFELKGSRKTTMICVYSPQNFSELNEIEDLYTTLRTTVEQVLLHNFLVITGDLNAKLSPDEIKLTFNKAKNRNGDLMEDFNRFSSNTSLMKPRWTFEYPFG